MKYLLLAVICLITSLIVIYMGLSIHTSIGNVIAVIGTFNFIFALLILYKWSK